MRTERVWTSSLALICCLVLGACAPRLYQRETLEIDHRDLDQFEIRYANFDGCLLRRPVPVSYRLQRGAYLLSLDVRFGNDQTAAGLDVGLSGAGALSASFPGLGTVAPTSTTESGTRYRLDSSAFESPLRVQVWRGGTLLGDETLGIRREHCRALSLGEGEDAAAPQP